MVMLVKGSEKLLRALVRYLQARKQEQSGLGEVQ